MPKEKPIISKILQETTQSHETREPLLRKLENHFKRRVVAYQTTFYLDNVLIDDKDATMLEEVLLCGERKKLLLILGSPGGYALAAERIIKVCRTYSGGDFDVLVPHMAKSAATIISFGSSKIWMGKTSELGPVDPQMNIKNIGRVSVDNYIKSYDALINKAVKTKGRIEPYLQQLSQYNDSNIQQLRQDLALSESMALQLLKTGMMKKSPEKAIKKEMEVFLNPEKTLEHGRPIYCEQAKNCGINIGVIDIEEPIWKTIWELHLRYDHIMREVGKIVETVDNLYVVHAPQKGRTEEE